MWYPIDDQNLPNDPHDDPNASNVELNFDSPRYHEETVVEFGGEREGSRHFAHAVLRFCTF